MEELKCSTSRNPLSQFTKQSGEDRSLQSEWTGAGPHTSHGSMRTNFQGISGDDQRMLEGFQQGHSGPEHAFNFDAMRSEVGNLQQKPVAPHGWVNDFRDGPGEEQFRTRSASPQVNGAVPVDGGARWKSEFNQVPVTE
jgi:hypothetical protein